MPANAAGATATSRSIYSREIMELFDAADRILKDRNPQTRSAHLYDDVREARRRHPHACVYLDDLGGNLKPARAMGMTTIKVESGPQAIAELEAATGMKLL